MAAPKKYPDELRERATRLASRRGRTAHGGRCAAAYRRATRDQPGDAAGWVKQAEIDAGQAPGVTTAEAQRIKALEAECGSCGSE
ncbi:hypothetical protein [Micrococcus luteus]|uniref:hypothetical protein n=1 Tax=Micrococcus luteus TaxID=1270 RepID=UPI0011C06076|nr:hypothetical protein [Micrococcus luteus]